MKRRGLLFSAALGLGLFALSDTNCEGSQSGDPVNIDYSDREPRRSQAPGSANVSRRRGLDDDLPKLDMGAEDRFRRHTVEIFRPDELFSNQALASRYPVHVRTLRILDQVDARCRMEEIGEFLRFDGQLGAGVPMTCFDLHAQVREKIFRSCKVGDGYDDCADKIVTNERRDAQLDACAEAFTKGKVLEDKREVTCRDAGVSDQLGSRAPGFYDSMDERGEDARSFVDDLFRNFERKTKPREMILRIEQVRILIQNQMILVESGQLDFEEFIDNLKFYRNFFISNFGGGISKRSGREQAAYNRILNDLSELISVYDQ
jgi:hypothetical protein